MDHPVVHFEMPYNDPERAEKFYNEAFGWQTGRMNEGADSYVTLQTTESKDGRPVTPGAINGGLWKKNDERPAQVPSVVIYAADIDAAMAKVTAAGGEVLGEPDDIPGVGRYVSFYDTEGNRVSLLQPGN